MNFLGKLLALMAAIGLVITQPHYAQGKTLHISNEQMGEIVRIARAINTVNPWLEETKCLEYAMGIHRAATKYAVDSNILVAIAQTETGFRENLSEGDAGEFGLCQIRKMWLHNPKFIKEFKKQTIRDLQKPSKNFMFAAWLLKDLKSREKKGGTLPYWSYYNSVKFENRFRYFLAVNRSLAAIRMAEGGETGRALAISELPERKAPEKIVEQQSVEREPGSLRTRKSNLVAENNVVQKISIQKSGIVSDEDMPKGRWIPDALRKLQAREQTQPEAPTNSKRQLSPAIIRAANELGYRNFLSNDAPVQD